MSKISDKVKIIADQVAEKLGFYVVEVEYVKKFDGMNLNIFLNKKGGINLNDTTDFLKEIDPLLDEADVSDGKPYTLNVSSAGLDRKFKTLKDYEMAIGENVEIKLFKPIEKEKVFVGELIEANNETIKIKTKNEEKIIEVKNIASASFYIEF